MNNDTQMLPTEDDIRLLDDRFSAKGVPVVERPNAAVLSWIQEQRGDGEIMPIARAFEEGFRRLHPSVQFDNRPLMFLSVSARGISYEFHPPMVFGTLTINLLDLAKITQPELERIYRADRAAFWELYYQSADCIDLFMGEMNSTRKTAEARRWAEVGKDQLQATGRQLVACTTDTSLPQAVALTAEMMAKAALIEEGVSEAELRRIGHDLDRLYKLVAQKRPGPNDPELQAIARSLPAYATARFSPSTLTAVRAQDLYRRALFVSAEAVRRTQRESCYRHLSADPAIPPRSW